MMKVILMIIAVVVLFVMANLIVKMIDENRLEYVNETIGIYKALICLKTFIEGLMIGSLTALILYLLLLLMATVY